MADIFNPKLRVKFLRGTTIEDTPVVAGNFLVDMDNQQIYMDVLSSDNTSIRVKVNNDFDINTFYTKNDCDNKFVSEDSLKDLSNLLDTEAENI